MSTSNESEHDRIQQWYAEMCKTGPEPPMTPPEFRGLYGNVVTADCYGLRTLGFEPDVILDLGANVGTFARFARSLFSSSTTKIVCVEPGERNFAFLKHLTEPDPNMVFVNKAIGEGNVFKALNTLNGAHEVYFGDGSPSVAEYTKDPASYVPCKVESVMLDRLVAEYCPPAARFMVKIDIESAERVVLDDPASVDVLSRADCFAIELHIGHDFNAPPLNRFHETHVIKQVHSELVARKR